MATAQKTTLAYMTRLVGGAKGGTIGHAYVWNARTTSYVWLMQTNTFRTYPAMVRARQHANALCRKHAKKIGVYAQISEQ